MSFSASISPESEEGIRIPLGKTCPALQASEGRGLTPRDPIQQTLGRGPAAAVGVVGAG